MFKKYKVINGVKYGPYLYENKRVGDKVVTVYLGKAPKEKEIYNKRFYAIFGIIILLFVVGFFLLSQIFSPTGNVVFDVETDYAYGENLSGNFNLVLKQGELLPADSILAVSLGDYYKEFALSEIVENEKVNGKYYVDNADISGSGEGYGISGASPEYPEIEFELKIYNKLESYDEQNSGNFGNQSEQSDETLNVPDFASEPDSVDSDSDISEPDTSYEIDSSSYVSEDSGTSASILTGNVVLNEEYEEEIIKASVKKGEEYVYEGDFDDFELVSGSVYYNGEKIDDSYISVRKSEKGIVVESDFEIYKEGFGSEYIGGEELVLSINVYDLEIPANEGDLFISLIYDNVEIVTREQKINLKDEKYDSGSGNDDINISDGLNDGYEIENEGYINETLVNISFNETINVSQKYTIIQQINDFSDLRISANGSVVINLEEYFIGGERYDFKGEGIIVNFSGSYVNLSAESDFRGAVRAYFTAINGSESLIGNEFIILVSSGAMSISTSREKIVVGKPVKWKKNVVLESPDRVLIDIPAEASNISIKKIDDNDETKIESVLTGNVVRTGKDNAIVRLFRKLMGVITGFVVSEDSDIVVELDENATSYVIEYETPAPEARETESKMGKEIIISAPDELNYTDVIASSVIDERYGYDEVNSIKVYWRNYGLSTYLKEVDEVLEEEVVEILNENEIDEDIVYNTDDAETGILTGRAVSDVDSNLSYILQEVPFDAYDLDFDGYIDYVEWVVPHLSEQTFEIIYISKAEHLDSNRTFIEDIYDFVSERDYNYKIIPAGDYVRVTFEKNLTSGNDITLYTKSDGAQVEVYEAYGNEVLMTFDISSDGEYKKYLTSLSGEQDTFDLLVKGGDVEFDYIVDPAYPDPSGYTISTCGEINAGGYFEINQNIETADVYPCLVISSNDVVINGMGYWINNSANDSYAIPIISNNNLTNVTIYNLSLYSSFSSAILFNESTENVTLYSNNIYSGYVGCSDSVFGCSGIVFNKYSERSYIGTSPICGMGYGYGYYYTCERYGNYIGQVFGNVGSALISFILNAYYNVVEDNGMDVNSAYGYAQGISFLGYGDSNIIENNSINSSNDLYVWKENNISLIDQNINRAFIANNSRINFINSLYGEINISRYGGITGDFNGSEVYLFGSLANGVIVSISNNYSYINSSNASEFNVSADLSFFNLHSGFSNPVIYKNGLLCDDCYNFSSLNAGNVSFNVSSWSDYYIGESFSDPCMEINVSGVYTLNSSFYGIEGTCFNISVDNVTLDGHGYTIDGDDSGSDYGVYAYGRNNITVKNFASVSDFGSLDYEEGSGIHLLFTNYSYILNNTVNSNADGIYVFGNYNTLSNNTVNSNSKGIYLLNSSDNNITNIMLSSNTYGLYLNNADNNNFTRFNSTQSSVRDLIVLGGASDDNYFFDSVFKTYQISVESKFYFVNSTYGELKFLSGISGTSSDLLSNGTSDIRFGNNSVYVNSEVSGLSKPANITLYGIGERGYTNIAILKDGTLCSDCYNFTALNALTVIFNVSSWSSYRIGNGDSVAPQISFVNPTPANGANQSANSIYVNVTSNDSSSDHYSFVDFDRSLVAWYRMDDINASGGPTDLSTYSNNASGYNGAYQIADGKFGEAFEFDGVDDYVSAGDDSDFDFGYKDFSLSAWIKTSSYSGYPAIIDKEYGYNTNGYNIVLDDANGKLRMLIHNDGGAYTFPGSPNLADNSWHHVSVVFDRDSDATGYVDGASVGTLDISSFSSTLMSNNYRLTMGAAYDGYTSYFTGSIDEVMIFNRTLSSEEVKALYNATAQQYYNNFTSLSQGLHTYKAYSVDSAGNKNYTELRTANVSYLVVTINSPLAMYYNSSTIIFNITTSVDADSAIMSLDNFANNISMQKNGQRDFNYTNSSIAEGLYTARFYVNDSYGNVESSKNVTFGVEFPPQISFVNPTPANGTNQSASSIYVNVTSNDSFSQLYSFVDSDRSLFAWYRMDDINASGGPTDLSTWSNNATNYSGAYQNNSGRFGKSFTFDGIDDYVSTGGNIDASQGSVSMWFSPRKTINSSYKQQGLFSDSTSGSNVKLMLRFWDGSGQLYFYNFDGSWKFAIGTTSTWNAGQWYHVIATWNSSNMSLYVNGNIEGSALAAAPETVSSSWVFGRSYSMSTPYYFNGSIDELLLFNRSLSFEEVKALYNATANQYYNNFTSLSQGQHTFRGHAVDSVGNRNYTELRTVNIDSVKPNINFTSPSETSGTIINRNNIVINVTSTDTNLKNITIELYNSTSLVNRTVSTSSPNYINITGLKQGVYYFNATAYDYAGNLNSTETRNVTINQSLLYTCDTLSDAGRSYILQNNVDNYAGTCFSISADNITLDGNGKYIDGIGSGFGVLINGVNNVTVKNIFVTDNYNGIFSIGDNNLFRNLSSYYHDDEGIFIWGDYNVIEDSNLSNNIMGKGLNILGNHNIFKNLTIKANFRGAFISQGFINNTFNKTLITGSIDDDLILSSNSNKTRFIDSVVEKYDVYSSTLIFENSTYGKIDYIAAKTATGTNLLGSVSSNVLFGNNSVYVDSILGASANITLYGIGERGYTRPAILKDGLTCEDCYNFTALNADTVIFNVSSWSNYSIGEWNDIVAPEISFVSPTPANGSSQNEKSIYVNVTSNDPLSEHYSFVDFDNSLIGWWRLEQGNGTYFVDETGKNNGTCSDTNCPSFNSSGMWNGSYLFENPLSGSSSTDYITMGNTQNLNAPNAVTVSAWIKTSTNFGSTSSAIYGVVVRTQDNSPYAGYGLAVGGNYISAKNKTVFITGNTYVSNALVGTTDVTDGRWHNIIGVYNGTHSLIYVDGNLDNSGVRTNGLNITNENFDIGADYSRGYRFNGTIDEVLVFNRSLSAQEIKALYNATAQQYYNNFTNLSYGNHTFRGHAVDSLGNRNYTELRTVNITKAAPNVPTLSYPSNYNVNYSRTPAFGWVSGGDDNGDTLSYEINITCYTSSGSQCAMPYGSDNRHYTYSTIGTSTSYTIPSELKYFIDDGDYYNWSVRAYDGEFYSSWSQSWQLNITTYVNISLPVDYIGFEEINYDTSYETTLESPQPFVIQNDGNVRVNVTVNATDLWVTESNPTEYYQFRIDNNTIASPDENLSFIWSQSVTSWTNMTNVSNLFLAISSLNYPDSNDSAEVHFKIRSPPNEGFGSRQSYVTFTASMSE